MSSLDSALPRPIFKPATKLRIKGKINEDPYRLGWDYSPNISSYEFQIDDLPFATAEGAVSLAAVMDCLRRQPDTKVTLSISNKAKAWSDALLLGQLIKGRWLDIGGFPFKYSRPTACYAYPLWRASILDRKQCLTLSERLSAQVKTLLESLKHPSAAEVAFATKLVFHEALLNVLEHAYAPGQDKIAFGAITITPVPREDHYIDSTFLTDEEAKWFKEHRNEGLMLEVAIADYGRNVPYTLWRAYGQEHPGKLSLKEGVRLGSREGQLARASFQHQISLWAFHHRSTRKPREEFTDELAFQNWRGLHRALSTTARLSGNMIMRSGQARTGYTFHHSLASVLTSTSSFKKHEFPGTTLTLRIPIPPTRRRQALPEQTEAPALNAAQIELDKVVKAVHLERYNWGDRFAGQARFVGISHPFNFMDEKGLSALLKVTLLIPPNLIPIHMFTRVEAPLSLNQLSPISGTLPGPPRLVAFWHPDHRFLWKFVGVIHRDVFPMITDLEEKGTASIPTGRIGRFFAESLVRAYAPYIEIENGFISLLPYKSQLPTATVNTALQYSFEQWSSESKNLWLFDEPHKFVRLPTGRLIKRYISVYKLLDSDEFLVREVGRKFISVLDSIKRKLGDVCVVADSEASYFIARMLLQEHRYHVDIYIDAAPKKLADKRPTIIFLDAIHKGDTLRTMAEKIKSCGGVICCLDLREGVSTSSGPSIESLLNFPFDPKEVGEDILTEGDTILEVDTVTHIPEKIAPYESLSLGIGSKRDDFANNNPQHFKVGLQLGESGRIHVARLPIGPLVLSHKVELIDWLEECFEAELAKIGLKDQPTDVVIFTRNEARIKQIVDECGTRLSGSKKKGARNVFSTVIPFVPAGSREIFSRPTLDLFYGLYKVKGADDLFIDSPTNFVALYLDDACVTGKTLLNFIIHSTMAGEGQLPRAIIAIPVLSRLSPAEEIFFKDICKTLSAHNNPEVTIPFSLSPLFRLQVRSFRTFESTPFHQLLAKLSTIKPHLDDRLSRYLEGVEARAREILTTFGLSKQQGSTLSHPFYNTDSLDEFVPSARVIRIRQLIALQEQNLGVLSRLLHELLEAFSEKDYKLLTMLAVEPSLMELSFLKKSGRLDLSKLAAEAITSVQPPALQSDALCVLALQGQPLIDRLSEILPYIGNDPDLVDQLLVFLLANKSAKSLWYGDVGTALRNCSSSLTPETYNYIKSWLQSFDEINEQRPVFSEYEAHQAINELISQTSYHGNGLNKLDALSDWVYSGEVERTLKDGKAVEKAINEVVTFFRSTLLPGIDGLIWWANFKGDPRASAELTRSYFRLVPTLSQLAGCTIDLPSGPIGSATSEQIEELWDQIRHLSLTSQADTFLSKEPSQLLEETPMLERWMPQFFCLPVEVASVLASDSLSRPEVKTTWEELGQGKVIVVIPCPLEPVQRVFSLLFQDMRNHGNEVGNKVTFHMEYSEGKSTLVGVFANSVREDNVPGAGLSQNLAANIGNQYGFDLVPDPPASSGEVYRVTVSFPDVFYMQWR
jgi:hypothetical protein